MTVQNLTTARFVLQCLQEELEEFDRCIPVAKNLQVGDVTDALVAILNDRQFLRLTTPPGPSRRPPRTSASRRAANAKRRAPVSRTA
jgi:hypothetical protein